MRAGLSAAPDRPCETPRVRNAGRRVPLLVLFLGCLATGCTGQPAAPLLASLNEAPVPADATRMSEQHRDGDFERGPSAEVEYSVPTTFNRACQDVLGALVREGYRLFDFSEDPQPVGDTATFCETEAADLSPGSSTPSVIAMAFPPGESTRYASDGIGVVFTPAHAGDAFPKGTHLRLSYH